MRALTLFVIGAAAAALMGADNSPRPYTDIPAIANGKTVIWHDPGDVSKLDLRYGIGGEEHAPVSPFRFVKEDASGSTPKVVVTDAHGRTYDVKFGDEAKPDTFAARLAWACGYWSEQNYMVNEGVIHGAGNLSRAAAYIGSNGRFRYGRFQLRSNDPEYLDNINWNWDQNPFAGAPQLNGLKILMMLVSNWDDKDFRDAATRGANTAIYRQDGQYIFFIDDWGASFGSWGKFFTRSKWKPDQYLRESHDFVKGLNLSIQWGYVGQHSGLMQQGIRPSDVRWLMQYLDRLTRDQLRAGLLASGATSQEAHNCIEGLELRIGQLRTVANFPDVAQASRPAR